MSEEQREPETIKMVMVGYHLGEGPDGIIVDNPEVSFINLSRGFVTNSDYGKIALLYKDTLAIAPETTAQLLMKKRKWFRE